MPGGFHYRLCLIIHWCSVEKGYENMGKQFTFFQLVLNIQGENIISNIHAKAVVSTLNSGQYFSDSINDSWSFSQADFPKRRCGT